MKKTVVFIGFFFFLLPLFGQRRWKTAGIPVSTAFSFAESQLVVPDGSGGAIVAWTDNGRLGFGLYAQRLNSRGARQWGDRGVGVLIGSPAGDKFAMIADGAGGAIITWEDYRSSNLGIYAQRIDLSGRKRWGARGAIVCYEGHGQNSPQLAPDGSGGAIFAWHDYRLSSACDIFAQRLDGAGRRCWAVDGVPVCTASGVDILGPMMSDGAGGVIFAWEDHREGVDANIYAQRVDGSGNMLWPLNGAAICTAPEVQALPKAVPDGAHGAIVAWSDVRNGHVEIYAQRVDPAGNGIWPADGIPVSTRGNYQYDAAIAEDGYGGAVIAWIQGLSPSDSYHDVFAQHLDESGNPIWADAGVPVCLAAGDQMGPKVVAALAGGAIITWNDGRALGPTGKVFASHLDAQGAPQWGENGIEVSLNNASQYQGRLIADGKGGAIAIYRNYASPIQAIHGQRLSPMYTVDFIAGEGGKIVGNLSQIVFSGANCTLVEAFPKAGYRFSSWSGTGGYYATDNPLRVKRVTKDLSIQANFKKKASILESETP